MALQTQDFEYVKTNHENKGVENSSQLTANNSPIGNMNIIHTFILNMFNFNHYDTNVINMRYR